MRWTIQRMESTMADEQFIIFRLGEQEYGLPIAAVDEIARPPEQIARLAQGAGFVDGVMNLRGTVVPIIDLRRRFELASKEPAGGRRILVLALGGGKTGFMVDGVSEVMRVPARRDPAGAGGVAGADAPDRPRRKSGRARPDDPAGRSRRNSSIRSRRTCWPSSIAPVSSKHRRLRDQAPHRRQFRADAEVARRHFPRGRRFRNSAGAQRSRGA